MVQITDKAAQDRATATFAPERFGRHRYQTPEGFVLWEGVRLARTGPMLYAPHEMPECEPGDNNMVVVERDAEVLFAPETILSFSGKPVTNEHPPEPVTPANFKAHAVGTVLNPRRGDGVEADYLVGDLLITDQGAIADIDAGKREVSAGYDVEVEPIKPGLARQTKNVGNHVALVKRGRAGPACAIQDKEPEMATKPKKRSVFDRLRTAFKANDEAAFEEELASAEEALDEDGDEPQRIVIEVKQPEPAAAEATSEDEGEDDPVSARLDKLEAAIAAIAASVQKLASAGGAEAQATDEDETETEAAEDEEAEEVEEVEKKVAMDAVAKAEILSPGIKLPAFTGAKVKGAAITALRRSALRAAMDGAAKAHVTTVLGVKPNIEAMKPAMVAVAFDAAAALVKAANSTGGQRERRADIPQGPMTAARYQQRILERRKAQV